MLRFPCLVLDHDDTVVQSEATINYPYFCYILDQFRPGATITWEEYCHGCFHLGFADMCREWYGFTEEELARENRGWKEHIRQHIPAPFPGIVEVVQRYRQEGGKICVVSHSSQENISRDYLAHIGFLPDDIYGWDLPEHQRKPSTFALENIQRKYGFSKEEMLIVDDMKPALDMGKAWGCSVAFAAWGKQEPAEIREFMQANCDYSFESPQALANFLFI